MQKTDSDKKVTTAHRTVKASSSKSRKNLQRPCGKVLDKSKELEAKIDKAELEEEKIASETVKAIEKEEDKKKAEAKCDQKDCDKCEKKSDCERDEKCETRDGSKCDDEKSTECKVTKQTPKILIRKAQFGADEKCKSKKQNDDKKFDEFEPRTTDKNTEGLKKEIKLEKKELIGATKKPGKLEVKTEKSATVKQIEKITVRKVTPGPTPQESLEEQAGFWSDLAEKDAAPKPTVVVVPKPEPIDFDKINEQMRARTIIPEERPHVPAKELKEQAIKKAVAATAKMPAAKKRSRRDNRVRMTWGRILLALSCTAAAVFAIVYFVNLSSPDVSLKVAAMQSGIEASYPSFTPRDYSLSDITSESGKITLTFRDNTGSTSYTLTEEKSSWDSNALLTNFVKLEYGDEYTAVREQGLTLYIADKGATWVNGGILFKLKVNTGSLTKKQIKSIAVSL